MFIDIIAFGLLIMSIFKGLGKGLIVALFSFLGFLMGLAAALKLSAVAADYLSKNTNIAGKWLPVIAFMAVFLLVVIVVRLGAKMLEQFVELATLGWLNRLAGVLLYVLIYLTVFSILIFYSEQLRLIKPETINASVTYGFIKPLAPKIMAGLGAVLPVFKNMFEKLLQFFQGISNNNNGAEHTYLHMHAGKAILV